MSKRINYLMSRVAGSMKTDGGKNVWLYLLCVLIAFVFWLLMSLDNEVQRDFDVPVELVEVPDSITVIDNFPPSISVGVKGKGSQLLRFMFSSSAPAMKIRFDRQFVGDNHISINRARLDARLREYFGTGVTITSCRPDSLLATFTALPGRRVALNVVADVQPHLQYVVSGPAKASVDSVTVYSVSELPSSLKSVSTEALFKTGLKDTSRFEVRVHPIAGTRIEPSVVTVTVPVQPLIVKKRMVPVEILNKPADMNVILFPSSVEISYLIPMSDYSEDAPMQAYADYKDIRHGVSKIPLMLSTPSDNMRNVSLSTDSVEYILEHR